MTISEEQLQEWELAASQRQYRFCIDLADLFVQAVPALIDFAAGVKEKP
jgi:hypothetical protein